MSPAARLLVRFAPPVVWMAVIAGLSSHYFGGDETGPFFVAVVGRLLPWAGPATLAALHVVARKLGHVVEFAILARLWLRTLAPGRPWARAALLAVVLAALYAVVDEARQGLAPNRSPSAWDVLIDTAGAVLAVVGRYQGGARDRGPGARRPG